MSLSYLKAKEELVTAGSDDCQQFFAENGYKLELAYYNLFHQNIPGARKIFLSLSEHDIRAHWGAFFSSLCQGKVEGYSSYLELRNFYEIDFNILFKYYLGNYVEEVCKYIDWLAVSNPEIYKYTGRVFMKNKYYDFGLYFLERGISSFYNDPELHYLLAEYYMSVSDREKAAKYLQSCLKVLPEYYPAEKMIKELSK
ncbi:hypothetical protein IKP85_05985 [bacterium]|nr:hypothetical protein [bacterium]